MQGLELLQFAMRPTTEFGTALGLWSRYLPGKEPSYLETDEDGDTRIGGDVDGIWIEFLRQPNRVDVAMLHGNPKTEEDQLTFLDPNLDPEKRAIDLAEMMIESLAPSFMEVMALFTEVTSTRKDSLAAMRKRISGIDLSSGVAEVELKLSGRRLSTVVPDLAILQEVTWRNGRRIAALPGNDDQTKAQLNAFGAQMMFRTLRQTEPLDEKTRSALFRELMDRIPAIWQEGKDAF